MKKILSMLLIFVMLLSLAACQATYGEQQDNAAVNSEGTNSSEETDQAIQAQQPSQPANNPMVNAVRTPILRRPDEYGMEYEDIFFEAIDGVTLNGWFIPAADSNKLIIINHFSPANRYGFPSHLEAYAHPMARGEINFLPRYKALHDAGYNIITYDMRNHGQSGDGFAGITGLGIHEWRDVVGSIRFAKEFDKTAGMEISLQSLCMGANSTLIAMTQSPEDFNDINSMIIVQPYVASTMLKNGMEMMGVDVSDPAVMEGVATSYEIESKGFRMEDHDMRNHMGSIDIPTLMVQVRNDPSFHEEDTQELYDLIPVEDKEMLWIEDTTFRFDGYQYFSDHPEKMIEWFDSHMK